jgi:hypothetical protein
MEYPASKSPCESCGYSTWPALPLKPSRYIDDEPIYVCAVCAIKIISEWSNKVSEALGIKWEKKEIGKPYVYPVTLKPGGFAE